MLSGRVFDFGIYDEPGMSDLIQYVEHQECLNLFRTRAPMFYEDEVKDFLFTLEFAEDTSSLIGMVHGVEIFLDETKLGQILVCL